MARKRNEFTCDLPRTRRGRAITPLRSLLYCKPCKTWPFLPPPWEHGVCVMCHAYQVVASA